MGHEAWTAYNAGLSDASDDQIAVYAHDKGAVLLSHDREFSQRRCKWIIGRHIWLRCTQPEAAELLAEQLPVLIPILERSNDLFIALSRSGHELTWG
jgi:predicted nuclease of predicted toxin-antitoxin system